MAAPIQYFITRPDRQVQTPEGLIQVKGEAVPLIPADVLPSWLLVLDVPARMQTATAKAMGLTYVSCEQPPPFELQVLVENIYRPTPYSQAQAQFLGHPITPPMDLQHAQLPGTEQALRFEMAGSGVAHGGNRVSADDQTGDLIDFFAPLDAGSSSQQPSVLQGQDAQLSQVAHGGNTPSSVSHASSWGGTTLAGTDIAAAFANAATSQPAPPMAPTAAMGEVAAGIYYQHIQSNGSVNALGPIDLRLPGQTSHQRQTPSGSDYERLYQDPGSIPMSTHNVSQYSFAPSSSSDTTNIAAPNHSSPPVNMVENGTQGDAGHVKPAPEVVATPQSLVLRSQAPRKLAHANNSAPGRGPQSPKTPPCQNWLRSGTCDDVRCSLEHYMPLTEEGLREAGLDDFPIWYRNTYGADIMPKKKLPRAKPGQGGKKGGAVLKSKPKPRRR